MSAVLGLAVLLPVDRTPHTSGVTFAVNRTASPTNHNNTALQQTADTAPDSSNNYTSLAAIRLNQAACEPLMQ
jgi:hypothetical protein